MAQASAMDTSGMLWMTFGGEFAGLRQTFQWTTISPALLRAAPLEAGAGHSGHKQIFDDFFEGGGQLIGSWSMLFISVHPRVIVPKDAEVSPQSCGRAMQSLHLTRLVVWC